MKLSQLRTLIHTIRDADDGEELPSSDMRYFFQVTGHKGDTVWLERVTGASIFRCLDCEDYFRGEPENGKHCASCAENYTSCERCGAVVHHDYAFSVEGIDETWCNRCHERYVRACEQCGTEYPRADMYERSGDYFCADCDPGEDYDSDRDPDGDILEHDVRVDRILSRPWLNCPGEATDSHGNRKAARPTLWMGFELEVYPASGSHLGTATSAVLSAFNGRGILKEDGSLGQNGFELVSLPATLAYHQTQWGDAFFGPLAKHCRGWQHRQAGMHVHVSRAALTPLQLGKLLVFVNGDGGAINNSRFIQSAAGRGPNDYCKHLDKKVKSAAPRDMRGNNWSPPTRLREHVANREPGTSIYSCGDGAPYADRYQAVNTTNTATIEFRIFQSNVARLGFLKNIEFCHAALMFCADTSHMLLSHGDFLQWLDARRGLYPNLVQWAVREKWLKRLHKPAHEPRPNHPEGLFPAVPEMAA